MIYVRTEHQEQASLIIWARMSASRFPALRLLFAIPNGGARHLRVAQSMKEEGAKPGVPDLFLPVARHGHHGLFLEMKTEKHRPKREGSKGGLSDVQIDWLTDLREQGFKAEVAYGRDEAIQILTDYLK
jgi:hypothetical protein